MAIINLNLMLLTFYHILSNCRILKNSNVCSYHACETSMTNKLAFQRPSLISTIEVPWIIEKDGVFIIQIPFILNHAIKFDEK